MITLKGKVIDIEGSEDPGCRDVGREGVAGGGGGLTILWSRLPVALRIRDQTAPDKPLSPWRYWKSRTAVSYFFFF